MNYKGRYMKGRFATWCIWNAAAIKVWFALRERKSKNEARIFSFISNSCVSRRALQLFGHSSTISGRDSKRKITFDAQVSLRPSKKISLHLRTLLRLLGIHYHHVNLASNITILIGRAQRIADFWRKRIRWARNKLGLWENYLTSSSTYQTKSRIEWI